MTLPSDLLHAIAIPGGGQVSLVVGAGCSFEEPTNLPLAGDCSEEAHRKLVTDNVLNDGECAEPRDLSALADLIKQKFDGKQLELVKRLPVKRFQNATANEGHLIAAALLLEGAITNIVTLNYDLSLSNALSMIGVSTEISVIRGPEQHGQLGNSNVIYLHRSADADPEEWILTTDALKYEWRDAWEETIGRYVICTPVTVFAGMGSSCGVLRHSTKKLKAAVGEACLVLVSPGDPKYSPFAKELEIDEENYVSLGWIAFMRELGKRFHSETVAEICSKCEELATREDWIDQDENDVGTVIVPRIRNAISKMGFLRFGRFRGAILLKTNTFPKIEDAHLYSVADLLMAVEFVKRAGGATGELSPDGHVIFARDNKPKNRVLLIDGSARNLRWLTLEHELKKYDELISHQNGNISRRILACGIMGPKPEAVSVPESIVLEREDENIVDAEPGFSYWDVEEIRKNEDEVGGLLE